MGKKGIFEYINLQKKTEKVTRGRNKGNPYEVVVAVSDTPGELGSHTEVGALLKTIGFEWIGGQRWQKFRDKFTKTDLDNVKKINDYLETLGNQVGDKEEFQTDLEALRDQIRASDLPLKTKSELDSKLETFIKKIADATDEKADSYFRNYLLSSSKFWKYSDENQLLIWLQKPDATNVASKWDWRKKFGREVVRPDEFITINCANRFYKDNNGVEREYKKAQQEADELYELKAKVGIIPRDMRMEELIKMRKNITRTAFAACPVYDISATEGRELPNMNRGSWTAEINNQNDNSAVANKVFEIAKKSLEANGIQVTQNPALAGEAGWSRRGQINVSSDVTGTYAVSTIIKEWAGDLLHQEGGKFYDNTLDYFEQKGELEPAHIEQIEKVREAAVAATICEFMGLPTKDQPKYMAQLRTHGGLDSAQLIRENISTLTAVSNYILKELKAHGRELNDAAGIAPQQPTIRQVPQQ